MATWKQRDKFQRNYLSLPARFGCFVSEHMRAYGCDQTTHMACVRMDVTKPRIWHACVWMWPNHAYGMRVQPSTSFTLSCEALCTILVKSYFVFLKFCRWFRTRDRQTDLEEFARLSWWRGTPVFFFIIAFDCFWTFCNFCFFKRLLECYCDAHLTSTTNNGLGCKSKDTWWKTCVMRLVFTSA